MSNGLGNNSAKFHAPTKNAMNKTNTTTMGTMLGTIKSVSHWDCGYNFPIDLVFHSGIPFGVKSIRKME